jgi:hypothetical protein
MFHRSIEVTGGLSRTPQTCHLPWNARCQPFSLGWFFPDTEGVTGSNPVAPTMSALARAFANLFVSAGHGSTVDGGGPAVENAHSYSTARVLSQRREQCALSTSGLAVRSPRQMVRSPSSTRSSRARSGWSPGWAGRWTMTRCSSAMSPTRMRTTPRGRWRWAETSAMDRSS